MIFPKLGAQRAYFLGGKMLVSGSVYGYLLVVIPGKYSTMKWHSWLENGHNLKMYVLLKINMFPLLCFFTRGYRLKGDKSIMDIMDNIMDIMDMSPNLFDKFVYVHPWGNDPIWPIFHFQMGRFNHQLVCHKLLPYKCWMFLSKFLPFTVKTCSPRKDWHFVDFRKKWWPEAAANFNVRLDRRGF